MRGDPHDPESWFDYAQEDLVRAYRRFREGDYMDCSHSPRSCLPEFVMASEGFMIGNHTRLQRETERDCLR